MLEFSTDDDIHTYAQTEGETIRRRNKKNVYESGVPAGPRKAGIEGDDTTGRVVMDGSEPEYGFDWTRNELLSRGIAGRGVASGGSLKPGGL